MARRRPNLIVGSLAILVLDQSLKYWLLLQGSADLNTKLAFSLGYGWWLIIGFLILGVLVWQKEQYRVALVIMFIAALTNLIDRWRTGGVIDYLALGNLHFNLADCLIVGLAAAIAVIEITKKEA